MEEETEPHKCAHLCFGGSSCFQRLLNEVEPLLLSCLVHLAFLNLLPAKEGGAGAVVSYNEVINLKLGRFPDQLMFEIDS